jgi:hypothetical protein
MATLIPSIQVELDGPSRTATQSTVDTVDTVATQATAQTADSRTRLFRAGSDTIISSGVKPASHSPWSKLGRRLSDAGRKVWHLASRIRHSTQTQDSDTDSTRDAAYEDAGRMEQSKKLHLTIFSDRLSYWEKLDELADKREGTSIPSIPDTDCPETTRYFMSEEDPDWFASCEVVPDGSKFTLTLYPLSHRYLRGLNTPQKGRKRGHILTEDKRSSFEEVRQDMKEFGDDRNDFWNVSAPSLKALSESLASCWQSSDGADAERMGSDSIPVEENVISAE